MCVVCCLLEGLTGQRKQHISVWPWIFSFRVFVCVPWKIFTGAQKQVHQHTVIHIDTHTHTLPYRVWEPRPLGQGCAVIGSISQYRRPWAISRWLGGQRLQQKMDSLCCVSVHACVCMYSCVCMCVPPMICVCMHYNEGELAWSNRALARNKLGAKHPHLYSTFVHVSLASLRTGYTLFTQSWSTMEGSMNEEWRTRGGKETGLDAQARRWRNKFVLGAELGAEWDFSLGLIYVYKWERGKRRLKMQPLQKSMHTSALHHLFVPSQKRNSSLNPNFVLFSALRRHVSTLSQGTVWKAATEWNKCFVLLFL